MWICGCNCCGTHCLLIWCLLWITGTPVFLGKHHVCLCCIIKNIKKNKLKSLDKIWCKHSVIQLKTENLSHGICSQNTQKVKKQTLFNQTKQDRMQFFFFLGNSLSQSHVQYKNKQITYLLPALAEVCLVLFLSQESNQQKISDLFVFVLYITLKNKSS